MRNSRWLPRQGLATTKRQQRRPRSDLVAVDPRLSASGEAGRRNTPPETAAGWRQGAVGPPSFTICCRPAASRWCRLGVEEERTQSKEGEVAISSKCAGDQGFPRIHTAITPPPRTGFEPAGPPFESGRA